MKLLLALLILNSSLAFATPGPDESGAESAPSEGSVDGKDAKRENEDEYRGHRGGPIGLLPDSEEESAPPLEHRERGKGSGGN